MVKSEAKKILYILLIYVFTCVKISASDIPVRRQAIKATFLSWYTGSCKISYERAVFRHQTMEVTAGYIGVGHDKFKNRPEGYTVRYAHKFILYGNDTQPLNGFYLRPEMIYSHFRYDTKEVRGRLLSNMGSIVCTIGYQYAVHRFIADLFLGSGYAFGNEADTRYQHGFALWDYSGRYYKHIDLTLGVKLGVSF